MQYAQQLANIGNVQNYAAQFKDTRLSSLKHPGEFFDYQRVWSIFSHDRGRGLMYRFPDQKIWQST
jgi:hypothetical protein